MQPMPSMPSMLPPLSWHQLLHTWAWHPVWCLAVLAGLAAYSWGLYAARRRGARAVHPARIVSFVAGMLVLALTLGSTVDVYAMTLFWDHMIEHLLLIMVVPALLVLGHPVTVLRSALSSRGRARLDAVLGSGPASVVTHPLVAVGLYTVVIVGTHLTSFMDDMAMHPWLGTGEQVLYLLAGYLLLLPLIGAEPIRWRLPYVFRVAMLLFAMVPDTVVGIVLMQSDSVLFPMMRADHPAWAPGAVDDQQIGGALMWVGGDGLMMLLAVGVAVAFIAQRDRGPVLGSWLEGVRRRTMSDHLAYAQVPVGSLGSQRVDLDSDTDVLAAYNRMLRQLHDGPAAPRGGEESSTSPSVEG